ALRKHATQGHDVGLGEGTLGDDEHGARRVIDDKSLRGVDRSRKARPSQPMLTQARLGAEAVVIEAKCRLPTDVGEGLLDPRPPGRAPQENTNSPQYH